MTWVGCFQKTVTVLMLTMPTRRLLTVLLLMVDMMDMLDMVLTPLLLIELPEVMLRSYPIRGALMIAVVILLFPPPALITHRLIFTYLCPNADPSLSLASAFAAT